MSEDPLRLGGMALQNGLFLHGPTSWSAAVRDDAGDVQIASGRKTTPPASVLRVPLARGVVRLTEMILLLPKVRSSLPAARFPFSSARVGVAMAVSATAAAALRASRP